MQEPLARKLRLLRAERGLTLEEAAKKIGVARESLGLLERGKRRPHTPTLAKLANGYGLSVEELLSLEEEDRPDSEEPDVPSGQAPSTSGPSAKGDPDRRILSYIDSWTNFIDALAGDIEEWRYEETGGVLDPADLPDDKFLAFFKGAMPYIQTYRRVYRVVYAEDVGLLPLLEAEVTLRGYKDEQVERFERAFRRLSRAMLPVASERVERRLDELALPKNVVQMFREARRESRAA